MLPQLPVSWNTLLIDELKKPYFQEIQDFLQGETSAGKTVYPEGKDIFAAFDATPLDTLKVVILGQDPYHGEGQAHGLSFSVQEGVKIPPSLRNIYKELENEGFPSPERKGIKREPSGNLNHWAQQGVLLLNSILTVEAGKPASHAKIGWAEFTDSVLKKISDSQTGIIFLLWGNFARGKKVLIDSNKHFILESPHPSPFSAHSGFFGNGHFKKVNEILKGQGQQEIQWGNM